MGLSRMITFAKDILRRILPPPAYQRLAVVYRAARWGAEPGTAAPAIAPIPVPEAVAVASPPEPPVAGNR
jgi:hypothetical protein